MKLILSDRPLNIPIQDRDKIHYIDLSSLKIAKTVQDASAAGPRHRADASSVTMPLRCIPALLKVTLYSTSAG